MVMEVGVSDGDEKSKAEEQRLTSAGLMKMGMEMEMAMVVPSLATVMLMVTGLIPALSLLRSASSFLRITPIPI